MVVVGEEGRDVPMPVGQVLALFEELFVILPNADDGWGHLDDSGSVLLADVHLFEPLARLELASGFVEPVTIGLESGIVRNEPVFPVSPVWLGMNSS